MLRQDNAIKHWLMRRRRVRNALAAIPYSPDVTHNFNTIQLPSWLTLARASVGTYVNQFGLVQTAANDIPRFDYHPISRQFLGLRREGSRINRIFPSADFSGAANWSGVNLTSSTNDAGTAPDGTLQATQIVTSGVGGLSRAALSVTSAQVTVASCWFKWTAGGTQLALVIGQEAFGGTGGNRSLVFDGVTGAFVSKHADISSYRIQQFGAGWWRVSAMFTPTATVATAVVGIYANQSGTTFLAWGADMGASTAFDSHVPTTTAAVTRAAETFTIAGAALTAMSGAAFSYLCEAYLDVTPPGNTSLLATNGTHSPLLVQTSGPAIASTNANAGVTITNGNAPIQTAFRACVAGSSTGRSLSALNANVVSDANAFTAITSATLGSANIVLFRRVAFWSRRLTDAEVQGATVVT